MHAHILNERETWRRMAPVARPSYAKFARRIARPFRTRVFSRLFQREEPSTFQRCLAVHMYNAARHGALD
jgi:hypothetical protein